MSAPAPAHAHTSTKSDRDRDRTTLGRYEIHGVLGRGGMATVHLGRMRGQVGFARPVAIKRLHEQYAKQPEFVAMFIDEARLAARVRHPNVVSVVDVVATDAELFQVMEYIHGESVARLLSSLAKGKKRIPSSIVCAIGIDLLEGLHAAHEAKSERGDALEMVHRDVSPQNVIVGSDGVTRVFDFGVAKATDRLASTSDGSLKGKIAYMSPEQLANEPVDRRADTWAAAVVIWEMFACRRLFVADSHAAMVLKVMGDRIDRVSERGGPAIVDAIIARGLTRDPKSRFQTAREMARALEAAIPPASKTAIAEWLATIAGDALRERQKMVEQMERSASHDRPSGATLVEVNDLVVAGEAAAAAAAAQAERPPPASIPMTTGTIEMPIENTRQLEAPIASPSIASPSIQETEKEQKREKKTGVGARTGLVIGAIAIAALGFAAGVWRTTITKATEALPTSEPSATPPTPPSSPPPQIVTSASSPAVPPPSHAPTRRPVAHPTKPSGPPRPSGNTSTASSSEFGRGPW